MTKYISQIDENNTVKIWAEEDYLSNPASDPFILQDINPNGMPWENKNEAEEWANNHISLLESYVPAPIEEITE